MKPQSVKATSSCPSFAMVLRETAFYRSQIGGSSVINYAYTDPPWRLMAKDISYFFVYIWALPWVGLPLRPTDSGKLDELYPSLQNLYCMLVHFILIVLQLGFLVSLPFLFMFPLWADTAYVVAFMLANKGLCRLLNGKEIEYHSDEQFAKRRPEHEHEQWIFLNGVAVGEHWLKSNLNRLALTFGRPILGIHNRTDGIIFDVIECLIQRNFTYATADVRVCYRLIKNVLYDPSKSKVVFILHSQGGIMGGMVLDWLLQEMPQDLLAKLEVYTFGNAANHFNNPHRHAISQRLTQTKPLEAMNTVMTETSYAASPTSPIVEVTEIKEPANDKRSPPQPPELKRESSTSSSFLSSRTTTAAQDRAIGYVEHYVHTTDFVAIWGVLHFATNRMASPQLPRFLGRLFARTTDRGGHQLNQHYLDGMFPLKPDPDRPGHFLGADEEDNEFMEEVIVVGEEGAAEENAREAFNVTWAGTDGFGTGDIVTAVEVHGLKKGHKMSKHDIKVKDLSRLWSYRNGRSPPETPPLLVTEAGLVRNATI
ncbi:alpha/beta-Hydrolase [Paramyrothecium foliicola]|nr:alpha/beta-Hydrolase [Paramyrothecium foliicola]